MNKQTLSSEYSLLNKEFLQVPDREGSTGGHYYDLEETEPEEVGGKSCLIGFVHLLLFSLVILELLDVQNLLVNFIDSSPDWCEMALFQTLRLLCYFVGVMNLFSFLGGLLISVELTSKLDLSLDLRIVWHKH